MFYVLILIQAFKALKLFSVTYRSLRCILTHIWSLTPFCMAIIHLRAAFLFKIMSHFKRARVFNNFTGSYWLAGVFTSLWPGSQNALYCCSLTLPSLPAVGRQTAVNVRLFVSSPLFAHFNPSIWNPSVSFLMWNHSSPSWTSLISWGDRLGTLQLKS